MKLIFRQPICFWALSKVDNRRLSSCCALWAGSLNPHGVHRDHREYAISSDGYLGNSACFNEERWIATR